jgi:hypothetical protein
VASATPTGKASAIGMGTVGSQYNTKFQLGLGDNFYCKYLFKKALKLLIVLIPKSNFPLK